MALLRFLMLMLFEIQARMLELWRTTMVASDGAAVAAVPAESPGHRRSCGSTELPSSYGLQRGRMVEPCSLHHDGPARVQGICRGSFGARGGHQSQSGDGRAPGGEHAQA